MDDSAPRDPRSFWRRLLSDDGWTPGRTRFSLLLAMIGAGGLGGALQGVCALSPPLRGDGFVWEEIESFARHGLGIGLAVGLSLILSRHVVVRVLSALVLGALAESARSVLQTGALEATDAARRAGILWELHSPVFLGAPVAAAMALAAHGVRRLSISGRGVLAALGVSGLLGIQSQSIFYHSIHSDFFRGSALSGSGEMALLTPDWIEGLANGWTFAVTIFAYELAARWLESRRAASWLTPVAAAVDVGILAGLYLLGAAMPFTPASEVDALAFSPDGTTVVSAHLGQTLRLWQVPPEGSGRVGELRERARMRISRTARGPLSFATDGRRVLVTEGSDRLRLWSAESLTLTDEVTYPGRRFRQAAFSKDGRSFAVMDGPEYVWLWRSRPADQRFTVSPIVLWREGFRFSAIRYSADSRRLLSADNQGIVCQWAADDGHLLGVALDEDPETHSKDGGTPADEVAMIRKFSGFPYDLCPADRTIALARSASGVLLMNDRSAARFEGTGNQPVTALAYAPDGRWLAIGDFGGRVTVARVLLPPSN
jgi:hypothetical protein